MPLKIDKIVHIGTNIFSDTPNPNNSAISKKNSQKKSKQHSSTFIASHPISNHQFTYNTNISSENLIDTNIQQE